MSPWTLNDEKPESRYQLRIRKFLGAALVLGTIGALFISPVSWPLLLIYTSIGAVCGLLDRERLDELGAVISFVIMGFGIGTLAPWLARVAPHWQAEWWQPVLIATSALLIAYAAPSIAARLKKPPAAVVYTRSSRRLKLREKR